MGTSFVSIHALFMATIAAVSSYYYYLHVQSQAAEKREQLTLDRLDQIRMLVERLGERLSLLEEQIDREETNFPLQVLGGLEHEYEAILMFLDQLRGSETFRFSRKQLIQQIQDLHLLNVDRLRKKIKNKSL